MGSIVGLGDTNSTMARCRWRFVLLLVVGGQGGCMLSMYDRVTRTVPIDTRVVQERVRFEPQSEARLRVTDVKVVGTQLAGRLERSATCLTVTERVVEPTLREEVVYVDDSGATRNLGSAAAYEIGFGLVMPLVVPIAYVVDRDEEGPLRDSEVQGALITGAVLGGVLLLDGIITAAASAGTGTKSERVGPTETEVAKGPFVPCEAEPIYVEVGTYVAVGTRSATVAVGADGRFAFDLRRLSAPLREDPGRAWSVIRTDGTTAPIDVPRAERYRLAGRLEARTSTASASRSPP